MSDESEKKDHARFSPSSSKRWLECQGSIAMIEKRHKIHGVPPESDAAKEGTDGHVCFEAFGKLGKPSTVGLVKTSQALKKKYPEEMVNHADDSMAAVRALIPDDAECLTEGKADLTWIDKEFYGTADYTIVELFGVLIVVDYKYGYLYVDPTENSQLIAYALARAKEYDFNFSEVWLVIVQPRQPDEDGNIVRIWKTDCKTLKKWAKKFEKGIAAAKKPNAPLKAGDWCRFCDGKIICPEFKNAAFEAAQVDFDEEDGEVNVPAIIEGKITPAYIGRALDACEKIESWIGELRKQAFMVLKGGGDIPGWKLVEKRAMRRWADPASVAKLANKKFGNEAFTAPELLSPAQMEKIAGKSFVAKHSVKISSGLTLASASDRRPKTSTVQNDFDDDI